MLKKKPKKKKENNPFKELVMILEKKTQLPDTAGKGVVKGNDVASMKDILEQESKDAWKSSYLISQENIKRLSIRI